jgi:DNA-directed RNA polymerase specialized sigma24 family protein
MSKKETKSISRHAAEGDELVALNKVARLLEILTRLNLQTMRGDRTQQDMVLMLDAVGCGPSEIADLLGTTANTVNVTLSNAKKKKRNK